VHRLLSLTIVGCLILIEPRASTAQQVAARTPPTGIFVVKEFVEGKDSSLAPAVFENPSISGVALRIGWRELEPTSGNFRWEMLDDLFARATTSRKAVGLIIVPGFETPAWALEGVQTASFGRKYGRHQGEVERRIPPIWLAGPRSCSRSPDATAASRSSASSARRGPRRSRSRCLYRTRRTMWSSGSGLATRP
jgi:hypothetical protein